MKLDKGKVISSDLSESEIEDIFREVTARNLGEKTDLSEFATKDCEAVRQTPDEVRAGGGFYERRPFDIDSSRVLFSSAFERLSGKTQCITSPGRDHITNRMVHSLRVAEISASIARCLGANEDLARTIGLSHDIGHAPLGHLGEMFISEAVYQEGEDVFRDIGIFRHNIQGVNVVDRVGNRSGFSKGSGMNLTNQVRHGILTHDGETDFKKVSPDRTITPERMNEDIERYIGEVIKESGDLVSSFEFSSADSVSKFISEVNSSIKKVKVVPATIEACIVLLVDTLHYAPEDFDDMVRLGVAKRSDLPLDVVKRLGTSSGDMMNSLIMDLLIHSYGKDTITYSEEVSSILIDFKKKFLYPKYAIVNSWVDSDAHDPRMLGSRGKIFKRTKYLFDKFLKALKDPGSYPNSPIIKNYMDGRDLHSYLNKLRERHGESAVVQIVVDYVAGFTDRYFFEESDKMFE